MKNLLKVIWKNLIKWIVKQGLKAFFNFVDKDKDGYISKQELKEFIKELNKYYKKVVMYSRKWFKNILLHNYFVIYFPLAQEEKKGAIRLSVWMLLVPFNIDCMTDFKKIGKNNKRRGANTERLAKKQLEAEGYFVSKSGGSLGAADLIAINKEKIKLIQVKRSCKLINTNFIRGIYSKDIEELTLIPTPENVNRELWVWIDRKGWQRYEVIDNEILPIWSDYFTYV